MKKKLVAITCAMALMLALPTLAFAAPSPSNPDPAPVVGKNEVVIAVKAGSGTVDSVDISTTDASNVPAGSEVLASFEVKGDATDVTLTFNVGAKYAGYSATIYIQHNDGTTEAKTVTVGADGMISVHVDKLSVFSIVMGEKGAAAAADKGAKSPATGVDFGTVAGGTVAMAIAAGVVFVALRKKVTE